MMITSVIWSWLAAIIVVLFRLTFNRETFCNDVQADADAYYATCPYRGAGEIDIAAVEQQVLFEPSYRDTGFLPDPLLDSEAGGWTSFV